MFEKPIPNLVSVTEGRTDTIIQNVRELRRLDPRCVLPLKLAFYWPVLIGVKYSMFLSRTVAAEVCMEAKSNEMAYAALKKLDHSGDLLFELS